MRHLDPRPLIGAVIAGALSGVFGLRTSDAILFGLLAFVLGLVMVAGGAGEPDGWPEAEHEETDGARREVSALTWSLVGREGRVAEPAVRRLRTVAVRRLAHHGIVLAHGLRQRQPASAPRVERVPDPVDDDAQRRARELLGERAWGILTAPGGRLPSLTDVAHCVDVIERLGTEPVERPLP